MLPLIRVMLIDPTPTMQTLIRGVVETADDLTLIDENVDPFRPRPRREEAPYDVMLLTTEEEAIWKLIRDLQRSFANVRVMLIVEEGSALLSPRLLTSGAAGCLLKGQVRKNLIHAIRALAHGESWLSFNVAQQLLTNASKAPDREKPPDLNEREWHILELLARGHSNREIAAAVQISTQRISNLLSEQIYPKLGVHRRGEAIRWFNQYGLD